MASTSEVGIDQIIANGASLNSAAASMGAKYQPSDVTISLDELELSHTIALAAQKVVTDLEGPEKTAINNREIAYNAIATEPTRWRNTLKGSKASKELMADMDSIMRKWRGKPAAGKKKKKKTGDDPSGDGTTPHSNSQQSFASKIGHLNSMVSLFVASEIYFPNEEDLKISYIEGLIANLNQLNNLAGVAEDALTQPREARYEAMEGVKGMSVLCRQAKSYIKGLERRARSGIR